MRLTLWLAYVRTITKRIAADADGHGVQNVLLLASTVSAPFDDVTRRFCDVRQCLKSLHNWNVASIVHDCGCRVAHLWGGREEGEAAVRA